MTPHELNLCIDAHNKRESNLREEGLINAYANAYWSRVKKMPRLDDLLKKTNGAKSRKPQSDNQMLQAVKKLNAAFGGGTSG